MLTLYELHWSHYCEKVRLALTFKGLEWRAVEVNAFARPQIRALGLKHRHAFPTLVDEERLHPKTGKPRVISESSPILAYLDEFYTDGPRLFPGDRQLQREMYCRLIEFDTELGIPARRLGYAQVMMECPDLLPRLFLGERHLLARVPGMRRLAGHGLGLMLCKRFDIHRSENLGLYEALERWLLQLAREVDGKAYVMGDVMTAVDIALATQLRPLRIVPFFFEHPELQGLFRLQERLLASLGASEPFPYEQAVAKARRARPPVRRRLRASPVAELPCQTDTWQTVAANDQQRIWTLSIVAYPCLYWYGLRRNKVRHAVATTQIR